MFLNNLFLFFRKTPPKVKEEMTVNLLTIQAILLALYITNGPGICSDAQEIVPNASEKDIENSLRQVLMSVLATFVG